MIRTKETLQKLIQESKARYTGGTEEGSKIWDDEQKVWYIAVDRLDLHTTDHYLYQ